MVRSKGTNEKPFRPTIMEGNGAPGDYNNLMKRCWEQDPEERCQMKDIIKIVHKLNRDFGMYVVQKCRPKYKIACILIPR